MNSNKISKYSSVCLCSKERKIRYLLELDLKDKSDENSEKVSIDLLD